MRFELTILGVSAALPTQGRFPTAHVLHVHEQLFLIDCGEGTQIQFEKYKVKRSKLNHIFISHLHGDHYFGLPGLLTSFALNQRKATLHIYGPKGLKDLIMPMVAPSPEYLTYPIRFYENEYTYDKIFENNSIEVYTLPLKHRAVTTGFLFKEKQRPRNIIAEKIATYSIPYALINAIKNGSDFTTANGEVIPNAELTKDPESPKSYAFCSDTAYKPDLVPYIKGVDLLYHESTFLHADEEKAIKTQHTTALQAGQIAQAAQVKKLLLGHFSSRYMDLNELALEARQAFKNSYLAEEGQQYTI